MTDPRPGGESGPVPARDLLRPAEEDPGPPAPAPAEAGPSGDAPAEEVAAGLEERAFEAEGEEWLARVAGVGLYGTGRMGWARLVAVHFFRVSDPQRPVREALVPMGQFRVLEVGELAKVLARAIPIELER